MDLPPSHARLLAFDGGGIRGLFSLEVARRMEALLREKHGRPDLVLADHFHYMGGTSTGAIIATFLSWGLPVDEVIRLYRDDVHQGRSHEHAQEPLRRSADPGFPAEFLCRKRWPAGTPLCRQDASIDSNRADASPLAGTATTTTPSASGAAFTPGERLDPRVSKRASCIATLSCCTPWRCPGAGLFLAEEQGIDIA